MVVNPPENMMRRVTTRRMFSFGLGLVALAACTPAIPDSGAPDPGRGVGFGDYDEYQEARAQRDAAPVSGSAVPQGVVSTESTQTAGAGAGTGSVASDTLAALDATDRARAEANSGILPVEADPSNPAPAVTDSAGISRENDFEAVGEQRTIESDAARIAANRAQYQVIEPGALPTRSGGSRPNIVAYALQSKHPVGTQVYSRLAIAAGNRYARNCAKYPSPDKAQEDFLASGGPERDRKGLDPDGDGFACAWTPAPFRKAVGG